VTLAGVSLRSEVNRQLGSRDSVDARSSEYLSADADAGSSRAVTKSKMSGAAAEGKSVSMINLQTDQQWDGDWLPLSKEIGNSARY